MTIRAAGPLAEGTAAGAGPPVANGTANRQDRALTKVRRERLQRTLDNPL